MIPLCVDCVQKVQKTIKVPIRYILMALTVVAVVLIKLFFPKEKGPVRFFLLLFLSYFRRISSKTG